MKQGGEKLNMLLYFLVTLFEVIEDVPLILFIPGENLVFKTFLFKPTSV